MTSPDPDVRQVVVSEVHIPAMATLGQGIGRDVLTGSAVTFVGDHRMMRHLGEALAEAPDESSLPVVDIETWQITGGGEAWSF